MSVYCKSCIHLDGQKKRCGKHNKKLTCAKHTGEISLFEKCAACNIDDIVDAPAVNLAEGEKAGEVLLEFYRALGWNGRDYLDPCKIRTTKAVFDSLRDAISGRCPDPVGVGMLMASSGPGTESDIPPGKVYLLEGWVRPAGPGEGGTDDGLRRQAV